MISPELLKIITFYCHGFKASMYEYVKELLSQCNSLMLQKQWPHAFHFESFSKVMNGACDAANTEMSDDRSGAGRAYGRQVALWLIV